MVLVTALFPGALCASTLNDTNQNDHDRDDQEGMNESAHGVRGHKTKNPEDDQDDGNGLEHGASPFAVGLRIEELAAHCRLTHGHSLKANSVKTALP